MAKGRKLATSRSERLLGSYTDYVHTQMMTTTDTSTESSDLVEEDIWSMVDDAVDRRCSEWTPRPQTIEISTSTRRKSAADNHHSHSHSHSRRHHVGGLSLVFEDPPAKVKTTSSRIVHQFSSRENGSNQNGSGQRKRSPFMAATSAPVNVPDWSKIYRVDSVDSINDSDEWAEPEFDSEMIPPHEYLARSRNKAATSVFEGVGRTLKGRDLSRVRDAVWSQTGFDG